MTNVIKLDVFENRKRMEALEAIPEEAHRNFASVEQKMFDIDNLALSTAEHGEVSNKRGIFVGKKCINVVSDSYEVHQPRDIYNAFADVASRTGLEVNRVLTNPHNGGLMISAKHTDCELLGDMHQANLTFYTSHCGRYKTFLTFDLLRMACFNQLPILYRNKSRFVFAEKHYKNALDIELIEKSLEQLPYSIAAYNEKAERLSDISMTIDGFVEWYANHYKLDRESRKFDAKVEKLKQTYMVATGQRELANSAYKAYQAVTFMNTHDMRESPLKNERVLTTASKDSLNALDSLLAVA